MQIRNSCTVDHLKIFFRAFNCLYSRIKVNLTQNLLRTVQLMKSYCFPLNCMPSKLFCHLLLNFRVLDNCINGAIYNIFGVHDTARMLFEEFSGIIKFISFNWWSCRKIHGQIDCDFTTVLYSKGLFDICHVCVRARERMCVFTLHFLCFFFCSVFLFVALDAK